MPAIAPQQDHDQAAAHAICAALTRRIQHHIAAHGGAIGFDHFMRLALYEPGLGYYTAGATKLGAAGDFITAPELAGDQARSLFALALAAAVQPVLSRLSGPAHILEFGAGSGKLCLDLLHALADARCLPRSYLILEPSAQLRQRQQQRLQGHTPCPVTWLSAWPDAPINGIVLGNEVLDAMPVQRFIINADHIAEQTVRLRDGALCWGQRRADAALTTQVEAIRRSLPQALPSGYVSEFNPALDGWFRSLSRCLGQGVALFIDYGYPRAEYYLPERCTGTLICHQRHRAHTDPLHQPGLQDISAFVDFTACAQAAQGAGLAVLGFTTQAAFLLDCGVHTVLESELAGQGVRYLQRAQELKTLTLPGDMGERFKGLAVGRGVEADVPGLRLSDQRWRL